MVRVRLWRQGLEHSVVLFGHDCLLENDSRTINVYQRERQEQQYKGLNSIAENNCRVLLSGQGGRWC